MGCGASTSRPPSGGSDPVAAPLHRYQDTLWTVDVTIDGRQTHRFLLDTAAGVTALDRRVAESVGLDPWGRLTGHRMSGERVDLQQVDPVPLAVGGRVVAPNAMAVVDLVGLLPEGWPPLGGVLALDALQAGPVTIDFAQRALVFETESSFAARTRRARPLKIRVGGQAQGAALDVFVAARGATGRDVWLEVDSGNTGPAIIARHAQPLLGLTGDSGEVELRLSPSGVNPSEWVAKDVIIDGSLGQSFLNGRALLLDLRVPAAWLHP